MAAPRKIRVGAVRYLNTKPLIYRLAELAPQAEMVLALPSQLADGLAAGDLDVALIPSVESFSDPRYTIVSDACIACRGPVLSVKLFSRVDPARIGTLALDVGSRTSAALVRILLKQRFGIEPRIERLELDTSIADCHTDAVLVIGDRAMRSPGGSFATVWDLGDEWCRWSELSFVFAMWTAREGTHLMGLDDALATARDLGVAHLDDIARAEAPALGLTVPECLAYLHDNLYFYMGPREQRGLAMFQRLAAEMGLVPTGVEIARFDSTTAL